MKLKLLANLKGLIVIKNNMSKTKRRKVGFVKTKGVAGWTMVPLSALEHYKRNIEPTASGDDIIDIGDWSGTRHQILQTKIDWFQEDMPEINHEKQDERMRQTDREYMEFRREINSKTPEQKAQRLEMFNLLYWGMKKQHQIPEDIKDKVIKIQTEFFEKNSNRIYCDPILFRPVFEGNNQIFNPSLTIIERTVSEDMRRARRQTNAH